MARWPLGEARAQCDNHRAFMLHPRLRLALLVFALLPVLGPIGCGTSRGALTPLAPGQLDERVALAAASPSLPPVEHALALAEAELALARPARAARAMELALGRAEAAWWTARLRGDADAIRATRRQLDRIATRARRWAARGDDPVLMVRAVLASASPRRHRRALRRAVVRLPEPPRSLDPAAMLALVGDDPAARRQIARWVDEAEWRSLEAGELEPEPEAVDLLVRALDDEHGNDRDRAELRRRAAAVVTADPWNLDVQILALGLAEVEAGVLSDDVQLVDDLYPRFEQTANTLARLTLRAQQSTSSRALPLALAWLMLNDELIGDAHGVLESMPVPPRDSAAQRVPRPAPGDDRGPAR